MKGSGQDLPLGPMLRSTGQMEPLAAAAGFEERADWRNPERAFGNDVSETAAEKLFVSFDNVDGDRIPRRCVRDKTDCVTDVSDTVASGSQ
jgi:hypothetical protein